MVLDVPPLIHEARIPDASITDRLEIAIKDNQGNVFYGDSTIFVKDPITQEIELPEGSWTLAAIPTPELHYETRKLLWIFQATGLVIILWLTTLVHLILNRQRSLALAVQQRKNFTNQSTTRSRNLGTEKSRKTIRGI